MCHRKCPEEGNKTHTWSKGSPVRGKTKIPSEIYPRVRGDVIEAYKILNNKYDRKITEFFLKLATLVQQEETR